MAYLIYLPEKVVYATPAAPDHAAALMSMAFTGEVGFLDTKVDGRKYVAVGKLLDDNPDCLLVQLIDAQKLYAFPNRLQNLMVLFTALWRWHFICSASGARWRGRSTIFYGLSTVSARDGCRPGWSPPIPMSSIGCPVISTE